MEKWEDGLFGFLIQKIEFSYSDTNWHIVHNETILLQRLYKGFCRDT